MLQPLPGLCFRSGPSNQLPLRRSLQIRYRGCGIKKRGGVAAPHSLNSFVFCGLLRLFGFQNDDPKKFGETIATPLKGGFLPAPIAALSGTPLSRPPGGRYRRYLSLREGSEKTPRSGGASRFAASLLSPLNSLKSRGGQESPFPSPWMIPDRSSSSRVRFAASRPGLLRADPKGWLFMREKGGLGRAASVRVSSDGG